MHGLYMQKYMEAVYMQSAIGSLVGGQNVLTHQPANSEAGELKVDINLLAAVVRLPIHIHSYFTCTYTKDNPR